MKNSIFVLVITLMLILPVYSLPENNYVAENVPEIEETVNSEGGIIEDDVQQAESVSIDENSVPKKELAATPYKHPTSKRKLAKKFLLAMFGVAGSSLIIFAGLSIYNRVRENFLAVSQNKEREEGSSLETPDNLTDAIKAFLDKTRWG